MSSRPRWIVAGLLAVAGVLFAIGTSYEAAERDEHSEETSEVSEEAAGESAGEANESGERILGIDATSPAVIATGVVLSFAAAGAVVFVRRRPADLAVAGFAAVFGALDAAEAVHAIREEEVTIAVLATVIALLHFGAAWLATRLEAEGVPDRAVPA